MRGIYYQKLKTWTAISKYIRRRDGRCMTCPTGNADDCGHYQHNGDKTNKNLGGNALWYQEFNYIAQCTRCNRFKSGNAVQATIVLQEKYGSKIFKKINKLYLTPKKWTLSELKQVESDYLNRLALLEE